MGLSSDHALYGVLLIAYGLISIFFPGLIFFWEWDWSWGWGGRDEEPSEPVVFVIRVLGAIALLAGAAMLLGRVVPGLHAFLPF